MRSGDQILNPTIDALLPIGRIVFLDIANYDCDGAGGTVMASFEALDTAGGLSIDNVLSYVAALVNWRWESLAFYRQQGVVLDAPSPRYG